VSFLFGSGYIGGLHSNSVGAFSLIRGHISLSKRSRDILVLC
jgi:hypothetical protein